MRIAVPNFESIKQQQKFIGREHEKNECLKKFVYNLLWFLVYSGTPYSALCGKMSKHINVYQSNHNQTNSSSPQRNIAKYYKANRSLSLISGEEERASFALNSFNSYPEQCTKKI